MISFDFLITSIVVVLIPGTGVIYTVANGLFVGRRASCVAAFGCTLGIIPALLASVLGLAVVFHTSALAFQILKYAGAAYLLYLAWQMWNSKDAIYLQENQQQLSYSRIATKGFMINILNPKLSLFFLAFLPQFISETAYQPLIQMWVLGLVFMLMTLVVFIAYGLLASKLKVFFVNSNKARIRMQKTFAAAFALLGLKLALD